MSRWHARLAQLRGDAHAPSARVQIVQSVQNPSRNPTFEQIEHFEHSPEAAEPPTDSWTEAHDEHAAIVEHDGGAPRAWAEGFARLDPSKPPANVPPRRWQRFIDDCGRFLDGGWADKAAVLGWGPLNLFGCDRKRPYYGRHAGLLWEVNGGRLVELRCDRAIVEIPGGTRQCYRRRPVEIGRVVLAWELAS